MVLTRAAARRLRDGAETGVSADSLSLREKVTCKRDAVWAARCDRDAYTLRPRSETEFPQVDHAVEVQLVEIALAAAAVSPSSDAAEAAAALRDALNSVENLNVTSRRVNQAKRGPFTAVANRARDGRLRAVSAEQLARQGAAKWLVDEGHWARVEKEVVLSWDALQSRLGEGSAPRAGMGKGAGKVLDATSEELRAVLEGSKLL
jgi:hypothetical protein